MATLSRPSARFAVRARNSVRDRTTNETPRTLRRRTNTDRENRERPHENDPNTRLTMRPCGYAAMHLVPRAPKQHNNRLPRRAALRRTVDQCDAAVLVLGRQDVRAMSRRFHPRQHEHFGRLESGGEIFAGELHFVAL